MKRISDFLRMIKFSHTIFAFPFAISSFILNRPALIQWDKVIFIILALVFARSGAMAFNRLADYKYDKDNDRTKKRELVTGKVSKNGVIIFMIIASLGFIFSAYMINRVSFILSPIALVLLCFYSYWKRFSIFSHLYLGMVIGLAPIAVDIALNESISVNSLLLFSSITFWIFGFDIIYSLLDIDFDKKAGLYSIPSKLGKSISLTISKTAYILMIVILLTLGIVNNFSIIYYLGVIGVGVLLLIQHLLVKPDDFSRINVAFLNLNSLISIIYLLIIVLEVFLRDL